MQMADEKYVEGVFDSIHSKYDLVDSFISLGMDRSWRSDMVSMIDANAPDTILDCGAGTGKLSLALKARFPRSRIIAFDLSESMLSGIKDRSIEKIRGSALDLPFEDSSIDIVTSAFLTRNLPERTKYYSEVRRVLKPGGAWINLDIHFPENLALRLIFRVYFFRAVPLFGDLVTRSGSYSYLARSVRNFPSAREFEGEVVDAGFSVSAREMRALNSVLIMRLLNSHSDNNIH